MATTQYGYFEAELIESVAEELCLDVVDLDMVFGYIEVFGYISKGANDEWLTTEAMLREHLANWIASACETNYGSGFDGLDGGAKFAEYFAENYMTEMGEIPSWMVIDWQSSWDRNLCYEFTISENGYAFADH
jgi:hypothetical protein